MQIQTSTKRNAADLIELVRKNIEMLAHYTLVGAITHIYLEGVHRNLPWATDRVKKMAIDAMDRAVIEWQQTGQTLGTMRALALITAAQKQRYDLFGKALSFLRETLEIRNLGEADPRPYEAAVMKFFEEVIDPADWSWVSINFGETSDRYSTGSSLAPSAIKLHEVANLVGQKVIQAYKEQGSRSESITIQFS
jgi:hypothetical protein